MKKAKKYIGRKILLEIGEKGSIAYFREERNFVCSVEDLKNDVELKEMYSNIEVLEDNIELYKCSKYNPQNLSQLKNIREHIAKRCKYNDYFTKAEIIDLLKNDYIVCIEGLQEIDLNDIENL